MTIFQTSLIVLYFYGILWVVIFHVTIVIILNLQELHPKKAEYLIGKCVCSDCSTRSPFPCISTSPWASLILKLGYSVTLQWGTSVQVKGELHVSLFKS